MKKSSFPVLAVLWALVATVFATVFPPAASSAPSAASSVSSEESDPSDLSGLSGLSDSEAPIFPLDEVRRGQKGYGLSVFAGTEPERFEVEVIGVQYNRKPGLSAILARLSGKGLERSGVFGGMSGSPVYFDGRLAGAVAFSYSFSYDAIAGITPIEAMRRLQDAPGEPPLVDSAAGVSATSVSATGVSARPDTGPRTVPVVTWDDLVRREFEADLFEKHLEQLVPSFAAGVRPGIQWSAGGFGERSAALLGRALGGLAPNGVQLGGMVPASAGGTSGQAMGGRGGEIKLPLGGRGGETLQPGSSLAAVLIHGDLHAAAYGTVTDRQGDSVLAFGHPMFSLGLTRVPMATAEVILVVDNQANSFKLSNVGPVVGAIDQDREAGLHGRIGLEAPTIPVRVKLRGLVEEEYHMEVAEIPQLTPNMVALAAYGSLEAGSFPAGFQGLDLEARFTLAGHDDLVVRQSFDTTQAGIESILYLMSFSSFLKLNDLAAVDIESVEVEYTQVDRPRTATLVGAHAARQIVEPGESVEILVELQAYRGERYRRPIEVRIPPDAPDGRFVVFVGDGTTMDGVRLTLERRAPQSFEQALEYMQSFSPRRQLRLFGLLPQPGLAVAGEVLPQLPGSVRSVFAAGGPTGTPLGLAIAVEKNEELDRPIVGFERVDLEVRRR